MKIFDPNDPFLTIQPDVKAARDAEVPDVIPPTLADRLLKVIEQEYGLLPSAPPVTGATIRATCRFCKGKACLSCDTLAEQEYRRQFPGGPQPMVTLRFDDPEERALLPKVLEGTADAPTQLDLMHQVERNVAEVKALQERLRSADRKDQS